MRLSIFLSGSNKVEKLCLLIFRYTVKKLRIRYISIYGERNINVTTQIHIFSLMLKVDYHNHLLIATISA